ncbi:hypothetical protein, partial [Mycobacterium simiae]|uniref:hypothetical protein n=1 Tax=Mycobacterium simiae TaxID=1784 RepID=UPI001CB6C0BE
MLDVLRKADAANAIKQAAEAAYQAWQSVEIPGCWFRHTVWSNSPLSFHSWLYAQPADQETARY